MTDVPLVNDRQARIDALVAEFRAAQQKRQLKAGIALWNRTETALRNLALPLATPAKPTDH